MNKQELMNRQMAKARKIRLINLANKGKETYLNKEWLFSRKCIDRMSLDKISSLCKVGYEVIWESLKKLGIPMVIDGRERYENWLEKHRKKIAYRKI